MTKKEPEIIWGTTDFRGSYVELSESSYQHILKGYSYMTDLIDNVKEVIESPNIVVQSEKYNDSLIHSRYGYTSEGTPNMWLHVPVSYQVGGYGYVVSAYTQSTTKPGKIIYVDMKS